MPFSSRITPFLWFNLNAPQAVEFYTSIFPNSKVHDTTHYGEGAPVPKATVMTIAFELDGQRLIALNGGPMFKFTEAISFVISCSTQSEIDYYWEKLTSGGGQPSQCGWLKDRFGLSWQVVPATLPEMLSDTVKGARVIQAMMPMVKLDMAKLQAAAEGR